MKMDKKQKEVKKNYREKRKQKNNNFNVSSKIWQFYFSQGKRARLKMFSTCIRVLERNKIKLFNSKRGQKAFTLCTLLVGV